MRFSLVIFFCAISFSASAQWWHISFKKHEVLPFLKPVKNHSISRIKTNLQFNDFAVKPLNLAQSQFSVEAASVLVMKMAKHNMRFRIYNEASYNFSDLAQLYIQLDRFSEAKWYILQSIKISREENDDKHTVSNLIKLASVKVDIGDLQSARNDLLEAHDIACAKGMQVQVIEVERSMQLLEQNKTAVAKPDVKYAEAADAGKKAWQ
jgi:hypothetical protein